jgi:hypothetical protein
LNEGLLSVEIRSVPTSLTASLAALPSMSLNPFYSILRFLRGLKLIAFQLS